jgi:HEPN domain-containing protein
MSEPHEIVRRVRQWVEKADHDLRTAEHTLTLEEDCPRDMVCFHAQPCVEKYLKALLVAESVEFPRSHDRVILLKRVKARVALGDRGWRSTAAEPVHDRSALSWRLGAHHP